MSLWLQGGHFILLSIVCANIYGDKATQMFSIICFSFGATSLTGLIIVMFMVDKGIMGYLPLFIISAAMTLLCLIMLHTIFKKEKLAISESKANDNENQNSR